MTLLLLALLGCTEDLAPRPVAHALARPEGRSVVLEPAAGPAPLAVPVRLVDEWGVAAGQSEALPADVGGAAVPVHLDGYGYGSVPVEGVGQVVVRVGEAETTAQITGAAWPPFNASYDSPGPDALWVQAATGGVVMADTERVWWVGPLGDRHVVAAPPFLLRGIRTGHADFNGVLDLLVFGADTVLLLRGRPGGGFTWGGAWQADGCEVVGADLGDVNGDGWPDIAIAWAQVGGGEVDVFEQVAPWAFEGAMPRGLMAEPVSLAVGDATLTGLDQITVTNADGEWERFELSGEGDGYSTAQPDTAQLPLEGDARTTVFTDGDLDDNGGEELFLVAPRLPGEVRTIQIWDLAEERPSISQVNPLDAEVALADGDGDGLVDLFMLESTGTLRLSSFNGTNLAQLDVGELGLQGPFAVSDLTGDRVGELAVQADGWAIWRRGRLLPVDEAQWWSPVASPASVLSPDGTGPAVSADFDGNAATHEVYTFRRDGTRTAVVAWFANGAGGLVEQAELLLSDHGDDPVDLLFCQDRLLAATETEVVAIRGGTGLSELARAATAVDAIACGPGPQGADVAVLSGSRVQLRTLALALISDRAADGAKDLALASLAGERQLVSCDVPECSVTRLPFDDDELTATWVPDGPITLSDGSTLPGGGLLDAVDVNGDGHLDLVSSRDGRIGVWLSSGQGLGPGRWLSTQRPIQGSVTATELNGDGAWDLVYVTPGAGMLATTRQ